MNDPSLPAVDERSKRNAEDIQKLWGRSSEQGEQIARMDEQLGNLKEGQEEAKLERTRQGGILDGIAAKLKVDHAPPAVAIAPATAPGLLASAPWWLKTLTVAVLAVVAAVAAWTAKLTGYTPLP